MKAKLLTKLTTLSAITLAISACGDGANYDDAPNYVNVQPVTVSGDLIATLDEESGIVAFDMLQGVTNPANTAIFARELTYVDELTDTDGNVIPNYEGPQLPFSAIYQSENTLFVNSDAWTNALVHPFTAENNPNAFSSGTYRFTYVIDNGADELVEREITVTVNGIEDTVEAIEINHSDGFSVAKGYPIQLNTTIEPLNATFPQLTYETSDETKATISSTGLIMGVDYGNVTFTVTSADGLVSETISGVVEDLASPLGISITKNNEVVTQLTLPVDSTIDLDYLLLPDDIAFDDEVMWSAEPADVISIDEFTGEVTGLMYDPDTPALNNATVTAYLVDDPNVKSVLPVATSASANLFQPLNGDFETGDVFPWAHYWETPGGAAAVTLSEAAAKDGMYGIHLGSDGSKHSGISIGPALAPQDVGGGLGRTFKLSYDVKLNNYQDSENRPMRFYFVAQGAWGARIEKWHNPVKSAEWTHVEVEFDEKDWSDVANNGRFEVYFIGGNGAIDAYFEIGRASCRERVCMFV